MAMAARRPAAPPPTVRPWCAARMPPSLPAPLLVGEHVPVVVDHKTVAAAVVELFPAASAPAGELEFLGDQPLMVLGQELVATVPVPARGEPRFKSGSGCAHGPPPFGAGTVTSDLRAEPAPHSPDWEGLPASWWSHARAWAGAPRRAGRANGSTAVRTTEARRVVPERLRPTPRASSPSCRGRRTRRSRSCRTRGRPGA